MNLIAALDLVVFHGTPRDKVRCIRRRGISRAIFQKVATSFLGVLFGVLTATQALAALTYAAFDLFTIQLPADSPGFEVGSANGGTPVAGGQVVGSYGFGDHAILWTSPTGTLSDLHPNSYANSEAAATDGSRQVGYAFTSVFQQHAMLWSGNSASAIDLHPAALGFTGSYATGVSGDQQVGAAAGDDFVYHAILWRGNAGSAVDLTPTLFGPIDPTGATPGSIGNSVALATDGSQQVGFVNRTVGLDALNNPIVESHPVVWSGTGASAVDLDPGSFIYSQVNGVSGGQQVGAGTDGTVFHALLWAGSAASFIDLGAGSIGSFNNAFAYGTNGSQQVGAMLSSVNGIQHAVLWSGTATSAVDLQTFLSGVFVGSTAYSIDARGNVFGIGVGTDGSRHAIEWVPVPEPATIALAMFGVLEFLLARRKELRTPTGT